MKPLILQHDNVDDRSEIHRLLTQLGKLERLAWLHWCCLQCVLPNSLLHPGLPPHHSGRPLEVFFDFWSLVNDYHLDPQKPLEILERLVRLPKRRPLLRRLWAGKPFSALGMP